MRPLAAPAGYFEVFQELFGLVENSGTIIYLAENVHIFH